MSQFVLFFRKYKGTFSEGHGVGQSRRYRLNGSCGFSNLQTVARKFPDKITHKEGTRKGRDGLPHQRRPRQGSRSRAPGGAGFARDRGNLPLSGAGRMPGGHAAVISTGRPENPVCHRRCWVSTRRRFYSASASAWPIDRTDASTCSGRHPIPSSRLISLPCSLQPGGVSRTQPEAPPAPAPNHRQCRRHVLSERVHERAQQACALAHNVGLRPAAEIVLAGVDLSLSTWG